MQGCRICKLRIQISWRHSAAGKAKPLKKPKSSKGELDEDDKAFLEKKKAEQVWLVCAAMRSAHCHQGQGRMQGAIQRYLNVLTTWGVCTGSVESIEREGGRQGRLCEEHQCDGEEEVNRWGISTAGPHLFSAMHSITLHCNAACPKYCSGMPWRV